MFFSRVVSHLLCGYTEYLMQIELNVELNLMQTELGGVLLLDMSLKTPAHSHSIKAVYSKCGLRSVICILNADSGFLMFEEDLAVAHTILKEWPFSLDINFEF